MSARYPTARDSGYEDRAFLPFGLKNFRRCEGTKELCVSPTSFRALVRRRAPAARRGSGVISYPVALRMGTLGQLPGFRILELAHDEEGGTQSALLQEIEQPVRGPGHGPLSKVYVRRFTESA